jgi:hypothetical integral membrane protein (TIGR02206 family)
MTFFTHFSELLNIIPVMPFDSTNILLIMIGLASAIIPILIAVPLTQQGRRNALLLWVTIIVLLEVSRQIWALSLGRYDFAEMLPLHLCGMQVILMPIMLKTNKREWRTFVYLTALIGAFAAILFNETILGKYPFWHFQTLQSFIIHGLIMMVPLYDIIWFKFRPSFKELPFAIIFMAYLGVQSFIINLITGGNYLFVSFAPKNTPLEWVEAAVGTNLYIPVMSVIVLIIWSLLLVPFIRKGGKNEAI